VNTNNKISNLVQSQVPFFVRNDHQNFVRFLEAYYEWLEQPDDQANTKQYNVVTRAKNARSFNDIDATTVDAFTNELYKTFLKLIPEDTAADKALILKHVKDFYRARGTEKSIRFLMRVLFDEQETEFYYPKKDVLRASDGKWFIEKSIKFSDILIDGVPSTNIDDIKKLVGQTITGSQSGATAAVERIDFYYEGGTEVRELKISNQTKDFVSGEQIFAQVNGQMIAANTFSGILNTVTLTNPGTLYQVGDLVTVESNTGSGAIVRVDSVTTGNIQSIFVTSAGAGYQANAQIFISDATGTGATANVLAVKDDGSVHPNSYNIVISLISGEANTNISNVIYSTLNSANANVTLANALSTFVFANTGPVISTKVLTSGNNYSPNPSFTTESNTRIAALGILGSMEIVDGGTNYAIGDTIDFINVIGGYGTGAAANVTNVNAQASNAINEVRFVEVPGHLIGGSGYSQSALPRANVVSATGNGANIVVRNILGFGVQYIALSSSIGQILRLTIVSGGSGYEEPPTLNFTSIGDGTAQAVSTIVSGAFSYPGRWLNDDGHLSSYNFLQDRDYYQNFSYVVKAKASIEKYRKALKDLVHPAGMKLFGEYMFVDDDSPIANSMKFLGVDGVYSVIPTGTYEANLGNVSIVYTDHGIVASDNVYIDFITGDLESNTFMVVGGNTDSFYITHYSNTINTSGLAVFSKLT
jgi:hypothetical protein